ncbi:T9SS type A sorting domain-containing protein, partial [bacterium]
QKLTSAPIQYLPQDNESCESLDATFFWGTVQNAARYSYLISTKADFSDSLFKDYSYADTSISIQLPNNSTVYYWKVGSAKIGEQLSWSDGFKFETKPAPPEMVAPADLLTCQDLNQTFSWNTINNAIEYRIQLSSKPNFSSVVKDTTITGTTINLGLNLYFNTYYWRVLARIPGCTTDWSEEREFRTVVGPPTLKSPADSANGLDLAITLEWPNTPGVDMYELQVSDDAGFNNLLVNQNNLQQIDYAFLASSYNKRYYWRMRTIGQGCTSVWSETHTFLTGYPKAVTTFPSDTSRCVPIETTFSWNPVPGATSYQLQASISQQFLKSDIRYEGTNITGTSITGNVKDATRQIYWRVRANDANNVGLWSDVLSFFTTGDAPITQEPIDGSVEVPRGVQIKWDLIGQATSSQLQIATDDQFNNIEIDMENIFDKKVDVVLNSYNTMYYYRIRVQSNGCYSAWTPVISFKSIQGFPNLIYPDNSETNITTDVQLEWSNVPTAITYDFRVATDENFVNFTGQNGVLANTYLYKGLMPNTKYYWMVRSNDKWGTSPWSQVYSFTTGKGFTNVPTLILPENGSVKTPIDGIISWYSSENATSYTLQISKDRKFNTIDKEIKDITDTTYSYTGLDNFTEYWVRVASVNETTTSDFSNSHKFRTIALPPSDKGLAITPADGATSIPYQKINFKWTNVPRTDLGLASESGYEFLLSKSDDFSDTVLYDKRVFEDGKLYLDIFNYSTTYFWKIRGWNEAGFGPWSDSFSFTTDIQTSVSDANYFDFGATVVPNPVENNAELRFNLDKPSKATLSIVDQTGKVVFRLDNIQANSNQNTINLNLNNFSNGSYLFNLTIGDKHQTGKIIISR